MTYVEAVRCAKCGTLHAREDDTYVRVEGAIYRGESGGLVGPTGDAVFCGPCFRTQVGRWTTGMTKESGHEHVSTGGWRPQAGYNP